MEKRIVSTVDELKQLGIWSAFCKREQWDEQRLEEMGVKGDMKFLVDADLFKK